MNKTIKIFIIKFYCIQWITIAISSSTFNDHQWQIINSSSSSTIIDKTSLPLISSSASVSASASGLASGTTKLKYQPIIKIDRNKINNLKKIDKLNNNNDDDNNFILSTKTTPTPTPTPSTPTYRKFKFNKRHHHHHHQQQQQQIRMNNSTTTTTTTALTSKFNDYGKNNNNKMIMMTTSKYDEPSSSLSSMNNLISKPELFLTKQQQFLHFYGPSIMKIINNDKNNYIKIKSTKNNKTVKMVKMMMKKKRKRIKLKQLNNKTKDNTIINIINPIDKSLINRYDYYDDDWTTTVLPSLKMKPLFAETTDEFDILRNDISIKPTTTTNMKQLRRSLSSNFIRRNNNTEYQTPANFRIQSNSFGRPATKPSYHWTFYNNNNNNNDVPPPPPINLTFFNNKLFNNQHHHQFNNQQHHQHFKQHHHHSSSTTRPSTIRPENFFTPKSSVDFFTNNQDNGNIDFRFSNRPLTTTTTTTINQPINRYQPSSTTMMRKTTTTTLAPAPISITSFSRNSFNDQRQQQHNNNFVKNNFYDDDYYRNYDNVLPITTSTTTMSTTAMPTRAPTRSRTSSKNKKMKKNDVNRCKEEQCHPPYCRCGSSTIPMGLMANDIPQLVMITFDDSINELNWDLYQEIFNNRFNPNGCPILGTFYVSHEWTDYSQVQNLYAKGHEMASHTITHSFGDKFSKEKWLNEVNGQREILSLYGGVKYEDVRGMRAPFLQPGGNRQYEMLYEANFTYDSSLPVFENNPPYWPYTFDYSLNHECMITPCPSKSFPGLWEVGMVMLIDHRGGRCSMVDACSHPSTDEGVFENLLKNFNRHYHSNKAPFGLYFHSAWFNTIHHRNGFIKFIDYIGKNNDVYFVTKWQLIQWMMQPTSLSNIHQFQPFQCNHYSDRKSCNRPKICSTLHRDGPRYLKTCQKCPKHYPWVGKTGFKNL